MRTVLQIWIATAAVLAGLLLSSFGASQNEKEAEVLLQAAMNTEVVKGDLEAAIQQYKRILASQGGSRSVAAKALVRMGHCYERLGNVEARQAYERVVREYADQSEAAAEARTRLAGLGKPGTAMATRQVWAGPHVDTLGGVSPDGRYLSFVDWETGDLAIRNLVTGENRRLTNKGSWTDSSQFALFSQFSPDGKQIAYDWFNQDSMWELRVGALDGSGHRTLCRNDKLEYVGTSGWSPDGKHVLARFVGRDKTYQLALVSVADGSASILKTFPWLRDSWYVGLSPDGKYVTYDFPPSEESSQRDIYVLAVDGSRDVRVVEHPADDWALGWTPDSKRILFASDRTGTWDAWLIPVVEGKPQGPPELVKRNIGQIEPLGFTRSGSFYYGVETGMVDVHVASLDIQKGKVIAPPARVAQRFLGTNRQADWSPDGRYLAYISGRGHRSTGFGPKVLCIASLETGKQRESLLNFNQASLFRWSPDGRSVLVKAWDPKQGEGYYLLDVETGQVKTVILGEEDRQAAWSRDGKILFLVRLPGGFAKKGDTGRILARDLETGAEKEIYRTVAAGVPGQGLINDLNISPDGGSLAFSVSNGRDPKCLKVLPVAGGAARDVYCVSKEAPEEIPNFSGLAWSADGRELLFMKMKDRGKDEQELWAVPVEGGQPRSLGLVMQGLSDPRMHPDGKRISFTAGKQAFEVWVMENFLPGAVATK